MKNCWRDLPKPIFVLAPMEGVTDAPFRQILAEVAKPDVMFTEFTSVEGMNSNGADNVKQRLAYTAAERPLIAQVWGIKPENFFKAGQEIVKLGFDGVDLNLGCPVKDVVKIGACSAMINNPKLAGEIIQAIKEGVNGKIPVSVKTRIGFKTFAVDEWCGFLLEQSIDALTIHGRTVKEMSKVPAHWDEIGKVVTLKNKMKVSTVIIGNGDVQTLEEAKSKVAEYGVDGVMIGRGIFHNPWLFDQSVDSTTKSPEVRLELLLRHTRLYVDRWGEGKNFEALKKYFKIYIRDFPEAGEWRGKFMECHSLHDVETIVSQLQGRTLKLPVDWFQAIKTQIGIGFRKRSTAEKAIKS